MDRSFYGKVITNEYIKNIYIYLKIIKYMRFYLILIYAGTNNFGVPTIRDESNPIVDYEKCKNI